MFCVVYQWLVKSGMEEEFRDTWRTITEAIFQQHGSLGSRLHEFTRCGGHVAGRAFEDPDGYRIVLQNGDWVLSIAG